MNFTDSLGSASIVGHKNKVGLWKQTWHARLRFPGAAMAAQMPTMKVRDCMLNLSVPICAKCMAALDLVGDERTAALAGCKKSDCRRLAERRVADILRAWTDQAWRDIANPPTEPEPVPVVVAAGPTVCDLLSAWESQWPMAMDATAGKEARRQATSFMRVMAYALDLWVVKEEGDGRRGVKVGERQADMRRLGPMLLSEVLTKAMARAYFENACKAAGVACSWAPSNAAPEYVTINRTMGQARCLFTKLALEFVYDGRVELPASLLAWKGFQLLPEPRKEIEPIVGDDFARLVAAREALKVSDPKLYLCNKVLVQTGLRSGSVEAMRGDWAVMDNGVWKLHAKEVKNNTVEYAVPITAELAEEIRAAGMTNDECGMTNGFCFGGTEAERHEMVCVRHNAWLKQFVEGPKRGSQGNHRLRKTLASAVLALRGIEAARVSLGHADKAVTEASYAAVGVQVTDVMRREFAAFL